MIYHIDRRLTRIIYSLGSSTFYYIVFIYIRKIEVAVINLRKILFFSSLENFEKNLIFRVWKFFEKNFILSTYHNLLQQNK